MRRRPAATTLQNHFAPSTQVACLRPQIPGTGTPTQPIQIRSPTLGSASSISTGNHHASLSQPHHCMAAQCPFRGREECDQDRRAHQLTSRLYFPVSTMHSLGMRIEEKTQLSSSENSKGGALISKCLESSIPTAKGWTL